MNRNRRLIGGNDMFESYHVRNGRRYGSRRNSLRSNATLLYMLQPHESQSRNRWIESIENVSLQNRLAHWPILRALAEEEPRPCPPRRCVIRVDLISVDPGQTIFNQGDACDDYYTFGSDFVKSPRRSITQGDQEGAQLFCPPEPLSAKIGFWLRDSGNCSPRNMVPRIEPGDCGGLLASASDHGRTDSNSWQLSP